MRDVEPVTHAHWIPDESETGEGSNTYKCSACDTIQIIADLWTAYLGPELPRVLTAVDVSNMMILFKVARNTANFRKTDNWVDIAGYAACGGEISESVAADGD